VAKSILPSDQLILYQMFGTLECATISIFRAAAAATFAESQNHWPMQRILSPWN